MKALYKSSEMTTKQKIINIITTKLEEESQEIENIRTNWITQLKKNDIIILESNKYILEKQIGEGTYGLVWKVSNNDTNYALKLCFTNDISGELIHQTLSNKINIIKCFNINLLEITKDIPDTYGFLMKLGNSINTPITYTQCFDILYDICNNLIELNKYDLCHNDVKPENIVKMNNGQYSLIDFNLSTTLNTMNTNDMIQTISYRSYELLVSKYNIDYQKTDIWALACSIIKLYTNKFIFYKSNKYKHLDSITMFFNLNDSDKFNYLYTIMYNEINNNCIEDYLNNIKNIDEYNNISFTNKKLLINILLVMLTPQDIRPSAIKLLKIISDSKFKIEK